MRIGKASSVTGSARPCITRARVIAGPEHGAKAGTIVVYYSLPKLAWWNIKGRLWVRRRLRVMTLEDHNIEGS